MRQLPRLYPIADLETLAKHGIGLRTFAQELRDAGVEILQLRDKLGAPQQVLEHAAVLSEVFAESRCLLVMNDRVDLMLLAGWQAAHLGHTDLPPDAARAVAAGREVVLGVSTHNEEQVRAAESGSADYVAIGPVFGTATKADAEPTVGLQGVRPARSLTHKPLVAIGGITLENAAAVMDAGADAVAVIGGLFRAGRAVGDVAQDFLRRLR